MLPHRGHAEDPESRNVAELGIGTNDKARLTGIILEDEKIYGTVHVTSRQLTFGGTVRAGIHIDAILLAPDSTSTTSSWFTVAV